jgi:hypothetical protein
MQQASTSPSPLPSLTIPLPLETQPQMNHPDWTAIAVYLTAGIFGFGVIGTLLKRLHEYLTRGEVFHESVLNKMDTLSAYAAENRNDTKEVIEQLQGVKSEVHGLKAEHAGLNRRVEILEERHK